jgi:hypothetical protein
MRVAGLVTWVLAALLGTFLLRTWLVHGGLRRRAHARLSPAHAPSSRFAPPLIFSHGGLAASGLAVWIAYLVAGDRHLAWAAFAILVPVAVLGSTMFGLWLRAGHLSRKGRHTYTPRHAAEDHFPPPAVLAHGTLAVATVVLVLLTALRIGS